MLDRSNYENIELGNFFFGNSRGEYVVPREEWQDAFQNFLETCGFDFDGHIENPDLFEYIRRDDVPVDSYDESSIPTDTIMKHGKPLGNDEYEYFGERYSIEDSIIPEYFDLLEQWHAGAISEEPDEDVFCIKRAWKHVQNRGEDTYFENDTFIIRPYYWGDSEEVACKPNFVYKPTGFELEWYKHPLRDSYCNQDIDFRKFTDILEDCKRSLAAGDGPKGLISKQDVINALEEEYPFLIQVARKMDDAESIIGKHVKNVINNIPEAKD